MRLAVSASELIRSVEAGQLRKKVPAFMPGDTLRVTIRVPEGDKERQQVFEGVVISRRGGGTREMVTVRKISFGVGVERTFPLHSPFISKLELVGRGKARRAKLYFLRDKTGKAARLRRQYVDESDAGVAGTAAEAAEAAAGEHTETPPAERPAPEAPPAEQEPAPKEKKGAKKKA